VNDIKRNAKKIEQHVSKMQNIDGDPKTRKTMKSAKYGQLDTVMYQWFIHAWIQGIPLSGLRGKKRQTQRRYFYVKYRTLPLRKHKPRSNKSK
jgi:hypothetical protein